MKRNDDDQPEKKENQGRSDKKQTTLTKLEVEAILKAGLVPLGKRLDGIEKLLGTEGNLSLILGEIKAMSQASSAAATEGNVHLVALGGKLDEVLEADEHRETRLTTAIHEASLKTETEVAQVGQHVAALITAHEQDRATSQDRHAVVLDQFGTLSSTVSEVQSVVQESQVVLGEIQGQLGEVAAKANGLTGQLDLVLGDGKKLRRWALSFDGQVGSVRELLGSMRELIVSENSLTRDNFGEAMASGIGFLAGELEEVGTGVTNVQAQLKNLPEVLGEELGGKFAQMLSLAQKILKSGELISGHATHISNSTSEAFKLHRHMLASITSEAKQAGASIALGVEQKINGFADKVEHRLDQVDARLKKTFDGFDPEDQLSMMKEVAETQQGWINDFQDLADSLIDARNQIVSGLGIQAATTKAENEKALAVLDQIIPHTNAVMEQFKQMAAGYKSAEDAGVALNNRITGMGIEAYKRDVERMQAEKDQARQDDREYLISELRVMIKPMIGEAISEELKGWLEGQIEVVEQAGTDQA